MKKAIVLMVIILLFASPAFASFNWGTDTYNSIGNQLIVNSLGDQSTVSTYGSLGTNDWIPENSVKNYLKLEGYTTAIDYNPSITNPQFSSAYNQSVPDGYTKLQFAGKLGDPRAIQDVYVKTEEYNRLNSEMQAQRILQESIERNDDVDRLGIDINNANDAREDGDNHLQNNIDNESAIRYKNDNDLQNNINNVNSKIDDTNNRVNDLEKTQTVISGEIRIYDGKKITVSSFVDYTTTRQTVERAGVKVVFKIGSSYEERELAKVNARLNKLEEKREAQVSEENTEVYQTENGMGIRTKF
jgi:hypothetical protein